MSLLVLSSHLISILLLLLHLKLSLHFHLIHLRHLIRVHIHHSRVHLVHLSWIHLYHIWVLLIHHLLLNIWIHSIHFHITHWRLFGRYFLLVWLLLILFRWWLLLLSGLFLGWLFSFNRWLLITHIYFNIQILSI